MSSQHARPLAPSLEKDPADHGPASADESLADAKARYKAEWAALSELERSQQAIDAAAGAPAARIAIRAKVAVHLARMDALYRAITEYRDLPVALQRELDLLDAA